MSHLTSNPFQRAFEFPRAGPLTPPDTDMDDVNHVTVSGPPPMDLDIEHDPPASHVQRRVGPVADVPNSHPRKLSSLTYINSGPREARERTVQRGMRWLVVVLPPSSFTEVHVGLGHTLSVGPTSRISQGLLVPLFPTMSAQLNAIAREFAFPSTAGICLYLHANHEGINIAPRISDESWQLLWGPFLDPRNSPPLKSQLPISGRIEFDIDIRKARWYDAWLGLVRKETRDVPVSITPSRHPSVSHHPGDSKTSFVEEHGDDPLDSISLLHMGKSTRAASLKHIPKKLSLLDRLESSSARSGSKLNPRNLSPPSPVEAVASAHPHLSPIPQVEEPQSAKKDLDNLVISWRANARSTSSPLGDTGQTSLDPANMPNVLPLVDDPDAEVDTPITLNLDDFDWSVSSVGPPDDEYDSDNELDSHIWRLPSVHLDRRVEGSVCLTPTTCTSFGPPDWDEDYRSIVSFISRLPSPDLATRMIEDCPATPSTATSWGPPLEYPPSPSGSNWTGVPSVDIGRRCTGSVPVTPSTATSWGPPLSFPPSPAVLSHVNTPDAGQRMFDPEAPSIPRHVRPAILEASDYEMEALEAPASNPPVQVVSWTRARAASIIGRPPAGRNDLTRSSLFTEVIAEVEDVEQAGTSPSQLDFPDQRPISPASNQVWPDATASNGEGGPSGHVFPPSEALNSTWKHVWPYTRPLETHDDASTFDFPDQEDTDSEWQRVWPDSQAHQTSLETNGEELTSGAEDEGLVGEGSVYSARGIVEDDNVSIYSPHNVHNGPTDDVATSSIEPLVIAEVGLIETQDIEVSKQGWSYIQATEISKHGWPYTEARSEPWNRVWPYIQVGSRAQDMGQMNLDPILVRLPSLYPVIELYPAVYPYNLADIYPSILPDITSAVAACADVLEPKEIMINQLPARYPNVGPYRSVYPFNVYEIYPTTSLEPQQYPLITASAALNTSPKPEKRYIARSSSSPSVKLVPSLPQNVELSTSVNTASSSGGCIGIGLPIRFAPVYPSVCPYPPVYPYFDLYPEVTHVAETPSKKVVSLPVKLPALYPIMEIYTPVYPHLVIYPYTTTLSEVQVHPSPLSVPVMKVVTGNEMPVFAPRQRPRYTHADLHRKVFGPGASSEAQAVDEDPEAEELPSYSPRRPPRYTHLEFHQQQEIDYVPTEEGELLVSPSSAPISIRRLPVPPQSPSSDTYTETDRRTSRPPPGPPPRIPLPDVPSNLTQDLPQPPPQSSRRRSGTVSLRPPLPVPPPLIGSPPGDSPMRTVRRLPSIPQIAGSPEISPMLQHSITMRPVGLPTDPAMHRRMSSTAPGRLSPSTFSPLPPVIEPDEDLDQYSYGTPPMSPSRRPLPQPQGYEIYRSGSASAHLPPTNLLDDSINVAELSRTNSLPSRPLPRANRSPAGSVAGMAKAFDNTTPMSEAGTPNGSPAPGRLSLNALSQFQTPPRHPLPPVPSSSRPVTKLDRSKFPFS